MAPPYNDLTYYTFGTPNGLKPAIVLEELGLKYKTETIDITKNTQKEDWFLEINPNGRIPALKDGEMRVFETGAIMMYLTDMYDPDKKISFEKGTEDYYECLSWLMWQMGGLGPMQGQANHFRAMAGARSDYSINRYLEETKRLFSVLELQLSKTDYLVANKYSIADIASFAWVRGAPMWLHIELDAWPGLKRWHDRIAERKAVERAKKVPPMARNEEEMREMVRGMQARVDGMVNSDLH
ncbi:MAG: hypothetical protein Q9227_003547 [Pyrenula ochraceoflavens]